MRSVVVTGVSTGIGRATVSVLVRQGWRVFGSVRQGEDGRDLQQEHKDAFVPLVFDVENEGSVVAAANDVHSALQGQSLGGLVNNAGSSFTDPLLIQSVSDFRKQVNVNLVGMFTVTRSFAPLLVPDLSDRSPRGRIVNISSIGGKMAYPFLGAYAAAKHGVEGFSESLRRELQLVGVDVVVVGPGSVKTAIWDKSEAAPVGHLEGTIWEKPFRAFRQMMIDGGRAGLEPEEVGEVIAKALTVSRPRARYAVMKGKFLNSTVPSMLPARVLDRLIGRRLGLLPPTKTGEFGRGATLSLK